MKRCFIVFSACFLLLPQAAVFAQGSECPTCSAAPAPLQKYITTMVKLIDLLPAGSPPQAESGTGAEVNFAQKAAASLGQADIIFSDVLYGGVGVGNMFEEIKQVLDGSVRARESISLASIDTKISERVFQTYSAGMISEAIPDDVYIQIDQTLQELEYVRLAKKKSGEYVMKGKGAAYKEYAKMLWSINKIYKSLHFENWMEANLSEINSGYDRVFTDKPEDAKEHPQKEQLALATKYVDVLIDRYLTTLTDGRTGEGTDWLEFTNNKCSYGDDGQCDFFIDIREVHDEYVCSTGVINSCEESWGSWKETASDSWYHAKTTFMDRGKGAINTFKESRSDLKDLFKKGSDKNKEGAQQRRTFFATSIYGQDISDDEKRWNKSGGYFQIDAYVDPMPVGVQAVKNMLVASYKESGKALSYVKSKVTNTPASEPDKNKASGGEKNENLADTQGKKQSLLNKFGNHIKESKDNAWTTDDAFIGLLQHQRAKRERIASFQATYMSVLELQQQFEQQAILVDTNVVTKRMPMLSAVVHKNMDMFGSKSDVGMIYNSMGQVCEIQCENVGGKCRYKGD